MKYDRINRMPSRTKSKSKKGKKKYDKKYLKREGKGGHGNDDDEYDSVDSNGNLKDFIDYGSDDSSSTESEIEHHKRPVRKAAIHARKKITNTIKQEERPFKNKIIVPKQRHVTPSKRSCPNKYSKRSAKRRSPISSSYSSESTESTETSDLTETSESTVSSKLTDDYDTQEQFEEDLEDNFDDFTDEEDEDKINSVQNNEEEENESNPSNGMVSFLLALGGQGNNHMIPKKHNLKKETENVKKFVKLLTTPKEDNTIDTQISQFKLLNEEQQKELIHALENKPNVSDTGINLMLKILTLKVSHDIKGMILSKYNSLQNLDNSSGEYHKLRNWLDKAVNMPFGIYKDVPIRLDDGSEKCGEYMKSAKKCLDDAVFGQEDAKLQIMQFIGAKIANPDGRGLSLLFIGPPGVGKTTIIKNGIAKALDWPFQFISLGGDSDASTYTGHQLVYESSHCGKIVNSLIASKSMSTVLMFDEVDKISQTPKGEEVMNLLIHLTDPVQNADFEDKYLSGIPIDLSKVMFVFSANDITKIDRVLLDRMTVVNLQGYDLKQKIIIAEQYLLPAALKEVNLTERVQISKDVISQIITEYASDDKGIRQLKRCIEQITQKINMLRMYNSPDLPFHIKDFSLPFIVKKEHVKLFLKRSNNHHSPPPGMYI